jgi:pimeloyl-ACP methyl ester carboxylesterase
MVKSDPILPPTEDCVPSLDPPPPFAAPPRFVEPQNEFRLNPMLREAAQRKDPWKILARAAAAFYRAQHPMMGSSPQEDMELGNALADLAVTGRAAYKRFQQTPGFLRGAVDQGLQDSLKQVPAPPPATFALLVSLAAATPADFASAVNPALDRAYAVAWALRGPVAQRAAARAALNWIAVSGEDDTPHRPVNVVSAPFEQYEIPVTVSGLLSLLSPLTLQTRFFIASAVEDPAPAALVPSTRDVPPDPVPKVPAGHQVILFLHGHSSGAEEALAIIPHILAAGLKRGTKYSVVSFDLPNNGYSDTFPHARVAQSTMTMFPGGVFDHGPIQTPILDFIENFIVAFVDALDLITPVKNRFAGVIGGSLGGNMGLRLGRRRDLAANPWLNAGIVSWSAGSVWVPMVQEVLKGIGPDRARGRWDVPEILTSRADHFQESFGKEFPLLASQPDQWYRDNWECKALHIEESRIARREIYNANFRQWHWRVAGEELIYSHFDRVVHGDDTTQRWYERNKVLQLLVAGEMDDYTGAAIYTYTQQLAQAMVQTPGRSLFLLNTGHSIHFERPKFLAGEIVDFLPGPQRTDISFLTPLLLNDSATDISFLTPLLLSQP